MKNGTISKRFVAYLFDWYIGGLFLSLPVGLIWMKVFNTKEMNQTLELLPKNTAIIAGGLSILFGLIYYVIIPLKFNGSTLGKKMFKLKVVKKNGSYLSFKDIILRQLVGIVLIEWGLYSLTNRIFEIIYLISDTNFTNISITIGLFISVISALMVLFTKNKMAIHDYIANTEVVNL